jgi:hypothetical protein
LAEVVTRVVMDNGEEFLLEQSPAEIIDSPIFKTYIAGVISGGTRRKMAGFLFYRSGTGIKHRRL